MQTDLHATFQISGTPLKLPDQPSPPILMLHSSGVSCSPASFLGNVNRLFYYRGPGLPLWVVGQTII